MNCGLPPPGKFLVKRETRVVEPSPVEKFDGSGNEGVASSAGILLLPQRRCPRRSL